MKKIFLAALTAGLTLNASAQNNVTFPDFITFLLR